MRVAVTGAAGYLGLSLLTRLLADGHQVVAIDHGAPSAPDQDGVTWLEGDVLDRERMRETLADVEIVYHLVARITLRDEDPVAWRLNTVGVRTVAQAALGAGVRRMVHCSSVHAFDTFSPGGLTESSPRSTADSALPVYDRSKYAGELELREIIAQGLDAVICNPTGVFGPVDHPAGLSRMNGMLRDAALGKIPVDVGGGFDWVDVRDVADGLVLAADRGRTGENYLLSGHFLTMHDAFRLAARIVGRRGPLMTLPLWVLTAIMPIAAPIGRRLGSDIVTKASMAALRAAPAVSHAKATSEFSYAPRPTEQTIRDLVSYFVQTGLLDRA